MPNSISQIATQLSSEFSKRANEADNSDSFVQENYELLKQSGLHSAGVPKELGGLGADMAELCDMLRIIAQGCGSTALAFSMHTHQVAVPAWRWKHQKLAAVEPLLKRVANDGIILLSSGGSDWIGGSGTAKKVENGYKISARKVFTSGSPIGDLLMTGALFEEEDGSQSVLHFGVPMSSPAVKVLDTWKVLGMRGTGSNDVVIDDLFVADEGIAFKRKAGEWHPVFHIIATVAFPLIYSVYLGVAESARKLALEMAGNRSILSDDAIVLAGQMETQLRATQNAHRSMVEAVNTNALTADTVNEAMIGRSLVATHGIKTVELAMELAGGYGFYRANGLEIKFRDIQAARYHPLQPAAQARYAGSLALGKSVDSIY